jgi:hypothetical protein
MSNVIGYQGTYHDPNQMGVRGAYIGEIIRNGQVIDRFIAPNLVVNQGLNATLNVMFRSAAQQANWYLGLFKGNYTPVAGLTAATVTAASTEATEYANATRPGLVAVDATAQLLTNAASRASFVFNASITVYGGFLISDNAKSGTAGILFSAARFPSAKAVVSGDELLLTYNLNASSV